MNTQHKSGLSGSHLKWIAIITMFVDHIGAVLLEYGLLPKVSDAVLGGNSFDYIVTDYHFWYYFNEVLRGIGRLAFPLFCFLLVEGYLHTKNVKKYALRLGLFALLSEVPFDLAVYQSYFNLSGQNVFFTLFIGLMVLWGLDYFTKTLTDAMLPFRYLVPLTGILAAQFLQTDYAGYGILLIFLLYECRNNRKLQCIAGAFLTLFSSYTAWIAFVFIWFYNGERGKQLPKYFFYAFYPVHLLVLFLVRIILL